MLLEACHVLEAFSFSFDSGVGRLLGSISSDSVSLVHLYNSRPRSVFGSSEDIRRFSVALFEKHISHLEQVVIPECRNLGVSLKKISRRFRDHHPSLKTRVRVYLEFLVANAQPIETVDISLFEAELVKEVGDYVTFELARVF